MAWQDTLEQLQSVDLGDLDLNNMGSWPAAVKGIVMTLLFAAVVAGGYFYYLTDKQELLERSQTKEIGLRGEYESKRAQAANLEAYRQQKQEMEATFGALLRQLPSDTEVPGLLEDITLTALDNELTIESIDLRAENRTEFYVELPIDIVVEGDYHLSLIHISEPTRRRGISYAVFCLKKKMEPCLDCRISSCQIP